MDSGIPSSFALACSRCSHSQSDATFSSQTNCDLVAHCAACTVLQRCRSNCVPTTGADWAEIDALVKDARSDLTRINQLQIRQRSQTRAVLERRRDLQRFIDLAQSLTAPVRKLPPEVLNEIFKLLCISNLSLDITDLGPKAQTLELSQVSAFWRAAILSRPALWSALRIHLQRVSTNEMSQLASYYLLSSRPRPLRLEISIYLETGRTIGTLAYDLFERLLAEYERWGDICVYVASTYTTKILDSLLFKFSAPSQMRFPALTNLEWCWDLGIERYHDFLSLADFPELLVCSTNTFSPIHLDSIRMPNLIELELHYYCEHHPLAALLCSLPNLRKCQIGSLAEEEISGSHLADYAPHCHLRRFTLGLHQDFSSLHRFFHSLSAPCLESFSLTSHVRHVAVTFPSTGLLSMLDRSQTKLKHLELDFLGEQTIIQILDHLPLLTNLSLLNIFDLSSELFKRLTVTSDSPNLVPQLRSLEIVDFSTRNNAKSAWFLQLAESTLDSLRDMVESRCRPSDSVGVSRLECLILSMNSHCDISPTPLAALPSKHRLRKRLQPLVDAGFSLKLIMYTPV